MSETGIGEPWHDPELRFLASLEQEVRRRAERAAISHAQRQRLHFAGRHPEHALALGATEACAERTPALPRQHATPGPPAPSSAGERRRRLRGPARIARRSLTLMALLCLLGASAYGAGLVLSSTSRNPLAAGHSPFALVASGGSGSARWMLRLYIREGELCRALSVAETEASACSSRPLAKQVQATSEESPSRRYVFGVTGEQIASVRVWLGKLVRTLPTQAPSAVQRARADLPAHVRYYLYVQQRLDAAGNPPALVQGLGADGQPLGRPVPSCPETGKLGRC